MATIRIKIRESSVPSKEGVLYYQVIHQRVARQIHTRHRLYPSEWDARRQRIILDPDAGTSRQHYLRAVKTALRDGITRLTIIIAKLEHEEGSYTSDQVIERYLALMARGGFIAFAEDLIRKFRENGKLCTAATYTTAANSFIRFRNGVDIPLQDMDTSLMAQYEAYLRGKRLCPNSTSFYMRNLRAIYNRSVEEGLTSQRHPFKHVYTGIDKTVKRAIPLKMIRRIRDMDLSADPRMEWARDIFMFSLYTRGMSFIDMAFLQKNDLRENVLSYRRRKTGQRLFIKWEKQMQQIINKHDTSGSPYLLPIIRKADADKRRQYKSAAHLMNKKRRRLGELVGLSTPLTSYVARHTWANMAKSQNIPLATISEAMGHDSEKTTRIYLAALDTSIVDRANSVILKSLRE